ncbi:MAG: transcription-repair coupling factor [Candidatus Latescibacteria bacterium]|nr:transcription-repair coupling factor [Candidatus Latescibacterota bacterium]
MLQLVLDIFSKHSALKHAAETLKKNRRIVLHGLNGCSSSFLAATILKNGEWLQNKPLLVVLPTDEEAEIFRDDIESIIGPDSLKYFPARDTNPYEESDSHFEVRSQRVETLDALEQGWSSIVISSVGALHDPTSPPGLVSLVSMTVRKGTHIVFDDFVRSLISKGFKRINTVHSAGQMAVRGGIVDLFPFGGDVPYRIEFWGDEIESIRTFSTSTQRSIDRISEFTLLPPDECITEAGLNTEDEHRISMVEEKTGINLQHIKKAFNGSDRPNGIEQSLYLVFGEKASLTHYFSDDAIVLVFDPDRCLHELTKRIEFATTLYDRHKFDNPNLAPVDYMFEKPRKLMAEFERKLLVENYTLRPPDHIVIDFNILPSRQYHGNIREALKDIQEAHSNGLQCHIACDNTGQAERLSELLDEVSDKFVIDVAKLSGGFTDSTSGIMLLTDHEIFSRYKRRVRYRRYKDGVPIPDFRALKIGDFVVHIDYGIGKYMGLKRITIGESETDCLKVDYQGNDKVFVPVEQLKRLKKFTSEEGVAPVVSKLGGTAWEKLKERTKKSIERMAKDLLQLYAERKAYPGHAFRPDETMLRALVDSFVFEDTPDQGKSWLDVRQDMESSAPMDRLLCGDVGFGKTEIALRAAFMAVLENMQVVILVPTTILADQHEETFRERFADFPVTVESLSRFRTRKEQKDILDRLAEGNVDIVIGTHRLLSKDVHIKKLGLLVIDEEQRFGVRHKEKIKKLRSNVDVLAMSATPIPRTLNMSLLGARDISFITTPPSDRYSVHTQILPFEEQHIMEAIMREIDRDGQVYFVHNRVRSIDAMASYLRTLLPSVDFVVAHGQLPEKELETIMRDFHHGKYQVLISTMIIENGLDIPSVNTIIINRADTFGLSQLYQLRGRVGRSNRRAYAYLLVPPKIPLSKVARDRLRIIEEFAELGSGFKIAMRDLEIRGAGNLLGTEQSGFIAAVGFDLYTELLHETVAELKGISIKKPPEVELHLKADMYIPESYIPDSNDRVVFYRRLSETVSTDEVSEIEQEIIDRFGRPDDPVMNLIATNYIRHYAALLEVKELSINRSEVNMFIPNGIEITRDSVENMVRKSPEKLKFSFSSQGLNVSFEIPDDHDGMLVGIKKVLQAIAK